MVLRLVAYAGWFSLFYVVLVGNVVLHEFGHAIIAKAVGFRIEHIVAGPFALWWRQGRLRIQLTGSFSHLLGGHVGTFPTGLSRHLRVAIIAVLAAGPIASFLRRTSRAPFSLR